MKNSSIVVLLLLCSSLFAQKSDILLRATVALEYGELDSAVFYLQKCEDEIESTQKYYYLGLAHYRKANYENAIKNLSMSNSFKEADFYIAKSYIHLNSISNAIAHLQKYLGSDQKIAKQKIILDPDFESISNNLEWKQLWKQYWYSEKDIILSSIDNKLLLNNEIEALDILNELQKTHGNTPDIYYQKAKVWIKMQSPKNAISELENAISISRNNEYFELLGDIYMDMQKYGKAKEAYYTLLHSDKLSYIMKYALSCIGKEEYSTAIKYLQHYCSYYYKDHRAFYYLAIAFQNDTDNLHALLTINKALALNNGTQEYYTKRAEIYSEVGSLEFAEKDYSAALDLIPNKETYYLRGVCREKRNNSNGACSDFKKALQQGMPEAQYKVNELCK